MALEDIKKKILDDAKQKKNEMLDEAKKKEKTILDEYKQRSQTYEKDMMQRAKTEGETLKRGILIEARQGVKNSVLKKKREIMGQTSREAMEKFTATADYLSVMKELVKKAVETGDEELIISTQEKKLNAQWLEGVNKEIKGKLKFAPEKGDFIGGVIVRRGNIFFNITLETLLRVMSEEVEKELADILF